MKSKTVYICSPLRAATAAEVEANKEMARKMCRLAVESGLRPLAPHIYFTQFMDDDIPSERGQAIEWNVHWLDEADELWVLEGRVSEGMKAEIEYAEKRHIPIRIITRAELGLAA